MHEPPRVRAKRQLLARSHTPAVTRREPWKKALGVYNFRPSNSIRGLPGAVEGRVSRRWFGSASCAASVINCEEDFINQLKQTGAQREDLGSAARANNAPSPRCSRRDPLAVPLLFSLSSGLCDDKCSRPAPRALGATIEAALGLFPPVAVR